MRMDPHIAPDSLAESARNLLLNCAGFQPGDTVVICREDASHGWYDDDAVNAVAQEAARLGLSVSLCDAAPPDAEQAAPLRDAIASAANIVYFARIGDHDRFGDLTRGAKRVMVYARTAPALASDYGRTDYRAMMALKQAVDAVVFAAQQITITCPLGTRVTGAVAGGPGAAPQDVTVKRFPLGVPAPVPAAGFHGQVAVAGALTPTGNRAYDPPVLPVSQPVMARIAQGRILSFEGAAEVTSAINDHYRRVAGRFGIDPFVVHSWHAGLHPGCAYFPDSGANSDYWSNTIFSSPRVLHFHTCGAFAPGEICWNIIDPTVHIDGQALWRAGRLQPMAFAPLRGILERWGVLKDLFR
ncbi:hypothetical protein [Actibacterium sp. D379-3]